MQPKPRRDTVIHIRIRKELKAEAQAEARARNMSFTRWIENLILRMLKKEVDES